MNASERALLIETIDRLFAGLVANGDAGNSKEAFRARWERVEEMGVGSLLVPESAGGLGGSFHDAALVAHRAALHAVSLPILETLLSRRLLAQAGSDSVSGAASIACVASGGLDARSGSTAANYSGVVHEVPWGRNVDHVLLELRQGEQSLLLRLATADACKRTLATNMAGEPRDTLEFRSAPVRTNVVPDSAASLMGLGALLRTAQIGGSLDCVLRQCIEHASGRSQFGRPLSQFQAIQHQIALLAEESAAVNCAAVAAARAAELGDAGFEIAAAKLRANRAVGIATSIAHQVHGAIGCTQEHALHRATQRLWSWRSEFGNDRHWALELGRRVARAGADAFWPTLTERGDRSGAPAES